MYFHSLPFIAFLIVAFAAYWSVHRNQTARLAMLLLASLVFYAAFTPFPLIIFASCAAIDFLVVRGMGRFTSTRARKLLLAVSVVTNLGVLATFKYADLLYSTSAWLLAQVGVSVRYEPLGLLLPIGLSFVVFQAISLTVDVYRGKVEPTFSYPEHLLYLLFFPQVVAGPIVRAKDLLDRFRQVPTLSAEDGARGLFRIVAGLVKKLVIADVLAAGIVDPVFADPARYTSAECAVAAVAYTLQLYFDFSAYSDVAIGAAALFGFSLPENFNKPYSATNLFDFWNRWHVSLSTWLRDYLYIPLGGNRVSRPRVLFNLMAVMALGGLWHGADWRFALWGAIHGLGLVVTRIFWWWRGRPDDPGVLRIAWGWTATMAVVVFSRVIFRADDVHLAAEMYAQLLAFTGGLANVSNIVWLTLLVAAALQALPHRAFELATRGFIVLPVPLRAAALVGIGLAIRQVGAAEIRPYIYFQF
jgi:D-alanyl-lipoteichoic acid acyltransferase DltB (MBOAT superfamily)